MARPHALVVLLACGVAHADVIDLPDTRAELTLDVRVWHSERGQAPLVYAATTDRGERLAITRAQVPNPDAWRTKTRDAYVEQIEKGVLARGYKRTARKVSEIEGVPVLDLELSPTRETSTSPERAARGPLVIRIILFRTYALALAIEGPRSSVSTARAIAKTFVPPPARPEGSP